MSAQTMGKKWPTWRLNHWDISGHEQRKYAISWWGSAWIVTYIRLANQILSFELRDAGSESGVVPHPQPVSDSNLFILKYPARPLVLAWIPHPQLCDQEGREQQKSSRVIRLCSWQKLETISNKSSYCLTPWYKSAFSGDQKPEVQPWEAHLWG